jgi:hypothetical protein
MKTTSYLRQPMCSKDLAEDRCENCGQTIRAISTVHPPSETTITDRIYRCPKDCAVYEAEAVQSYADGEKIWVNVMQCANDDEALEQAKQWGGP